MEKINLNLDWKFRKLNDDSFKIIDLPHDAMLEEKKSIKSLGKGNISYFECGEYEYIKTINFSKEQIEKKNLIIEFEGVYHNAEIYINGNKVAFRPYGYTNFYVSSESFVEGDNELKVIVRNNDQPNSRWYSGSGIYRPVNLFIFERKHILINGLKIKTISIYPKQIEIDVKTNSSGRISFAILDKEKCLYTKDYVIDESNHLNIIMSVDSLKLWDENNPNLYTIEAKFEEDIVKEKFGVRLIKCSPKDGLLINNQRVILKGACIHHDNGILGAKGYKEAEYRKISLLKECGYNAIRSAHNPCSKYILEACDELGMYVVDEYADEWYVHKTLYGYSEYLSSYWKQDLLDMVEKDYNHPSVIMYSTGNEVGETSEAKGIILTKTFTEYLHNLDQTRLVTCGINIWFNAMYSLGFGQYSDEKARKALKATSEKERKKHAVGSEFFNNIAGLLGADFMKTMATLPLCDRVSKEAYSCLDVAGYNYGIKRYEKDVKKYPSRIILGTETFCSDAYKFMQLASKYEQIIGDFVWCGIDYLGEVGLGAYEYFDYAPKDLLDPGWMHSGSGRIDLIGTLRGEANYTKVVFNKEPISIGVIPVNHTHSKHTPSAWKFTNTYSSWSWIGQDNKDAIVEVYSNSNKVELYLNDELVGSKKSKNNCVFRFKLKYREGILKAIGKDSNDNIIASTTLKSASKETKLSIIPIDKLTDDIYYLRLSYTDNDGIIKVLNRGRINVDVKGGKIVNIGSASPYYPQGYNKKNVETYYGSALVVIKKTSSKVTVDISDGLLKNTYTF